MGKTKKIKVRFILVEPRRQASQNPWEVRYKKNPSGNTLAELRQRLRKSSIKQFTIKCFFLFLIFSRGLPRWRSPAEIAARWRYRPPIKNLTAHYNSPFCVSFSFLFPPGSPKTSLDMSKWGLNII